MLGHRSSSSSSAMILSSSNRRRFRVPRLDAGMPSLEAPKSSTLEWVSEVQIKRHGSFYLDVGKIVTLHSSNTSPLVKFDLPNAAKVSQEILRAFACLDVPQLQRSV